MSVGWEPRNTMSTIPSYRNMRLSEEGSSCHSNDDEQMCVVEGLGPALEGAGAQCLLCGMTPERAQCMADAKQRGGMV